MGRSAIEWTDATWNPVRGCSRVSAGCDNCYAMRQAHRSSAPGGAYEGLTVIRNGKVDWRGTARLVPELLDQPLRWRKPRRVFVNSMSDLFHESLPDEAIDQVFGAMAVASRHTFQVLTKRPERMLAFLDDRHRKNRIADAPPAGWALRYEGQAVMYWPLPNVWLGVSVEDQATADERIPLLLQVPAAVRFVSYEPALGPVAIPWALPPKGKPAWLMDAARRAFEVPGLDWVIVGGESGPGARPFDVAWARSVVEQCKASSVPVFVKQLGARPGYRPENGAVPLPGANCDALYDDGNGWYRYGLLDRKGGDPAEWPEDLRVREFPA